MSDLERLVAIQDITQLKGMRDHALDMKDWAFYETLHAPDMYTHADGVDYPPITSASEMVKLVSGRLEGRKTAHLCHTPVITFESPTKAKGVWAMEDQLFWKQGDEDHWYHGLGFYHETYEKRDGKWVFTSRILKRTYTNMSKGAKLGAQK
jgi:hypothetical protein